MSVSMSTPIPLEHFVHRANSARELGGGLDINKNNELVVKGNTWLGRAALWVKQHMFPDKIRAQNQRVLDAFNQTLRHEKDFHQDHTFAESLGDAKQFARNVAIAAQSNQKILQKEQKIFMQKQRVERQKRLATEQFDLNQLYRAPKAENYGMSPRLTKALAHASLLTGSDLGRLRDRYKNLVAAIATDENFAQEGKIPGGSGKSYLARGGDLSSSFLDSAYYLAVDDAYEKSGQDKAQGERYGFANQDEVLWVRQKLEEV